MAGGVGKEVMRDYTFCPDDGPPVPVSEMPAEAIARLLAEGALPLDGSAGPTEADVLERLRIEVLICEFALR